MTLRLRLAQLHAHVKVAATMAAVMNWTTSSTRPTKRCTLPPTTTLKISMFIGSTTSTLGGTTVTSTSAIAPLPEVFPQVNELS